MLLLIAAAFVLGCAWAEQDVCVDCDRAEEVDLSWLSQVNSEPKKLRIGISISISKDPSSIFTNGAKQTAMMLYQLLAHHHDVFLVNLDSGSVDNVPPDWKLGAFDIIEFDQAVERKPHIFFECGMQLSRFRLLCLRAFGTKIVTYRTGNDFYMSSEMMLFGKDNGAIFYTTGYDYIWTLPSFERTSDFQRISLKAPVKVVPYVYTPYFFAGTAKSLPSRQQYTPREKAKVLGVFESNLVIVKMAVYPMLIMEEVYRAHPELIKSAKVTNADVMWRDHPEFKHFSENLSIVKDGVAEILGRFKLAWYLSEYVDIIISHQVHNELNYLYLDALYAHYPIVHNSPYFKDCGYYYDEFNVTQGAEQVMNAILNHDNNIEAYNKKADECVWRFHVDNPINIDTYDTLMHDLVAQPPITLTTDDLQFLQENIKDLTSAR